MKILRWWRNNVSPLSRQHLTASLVAGFSVGFFVYILYLQTPVFSRRVLLLGIAIAAAATVMASFLLKRHPFAYRNDYFISWPSFLLASLLFFLALPFYFFLPPAPKLPFLQRESTLVISIRTGADPVAWSQFRRIYMNSGVEKWGFHGFQVSGPWVSSGEDFILQPESTGQIVWTGRVGQRASLALPIPSDQVRITTVWDNEIRHVPVGKSPYVQNRNFIPPLWYAGLIYAIAWIPLFSSFMIMDGFPLVRRLALPALILYLALIQVDLQFEMLEKEFHMPLQEAIETVQLARHRAVIDGYAPNPWQYRVFSEWILASFLSVSAGFLKLENSASLSLQGLRVVQNLLLLTAAYMYFVRLGITRTVSTYGVFLLGGGMLHAFYQSDLSFNTYFDIFFFLLAAVLILDARYEWVLVLMVFAAPNRETSVLIPMMLIAWGWFGKPEKRTKAILCGVAGLLVWGLVFTGLRLYYPDVPMFRVGDELLPGWKLFRYNLTIPEMPVLLFQTLGFLPLAGILAYRYWPPFVRIGFLLLVPVWILAHAFSSVWAETRLFLVLLALVFIPAVLPFIDRWLWEIRQKASMPIAGSAQNLVEN